MSAYKSDFLQILDERGFIRQLSNADGLDKLLAQEMVTAYIGFDCTARSLHVGSLVQIMTLYWLQKTGHRPLTLMGGGTSMIGDPSGKDESRVMLNIEEIKSNKASLRRVFSKFLKFGDDLLDAMMQDNAEWLTALNYVDFLREYGKNFSVNQMLARDSVKNRLDREQHLSFLEFNYMIFQAYDFVELNKRYGCRLQMGGSDQWGNIVSGAELGRRSGTKELFALTTPLLTTSSGAKMGKTAKGAIWLAEDMLSPYDYWQYWRNCEDADIGRFLKLFTVLPLDEIARLDPLEGEEKNEAKKILATEATAMAHGRKAADLASQTARITFEEGMTSDKLPTIKIKKELLDEGIGLLGLIVEAGFATSNGEARHHVKAGAIRVNNAVIHDERTTLDLNNLDDNGAIKLSMGKKRHTLVRSD